MQTKQFKKLQAQWYKKLAESGFVDKEDHSHYDVPLKQWDSFYYQARYTPEQYQEHLEYFNWASSFLSRYKFQNKLEKQMWAMHTDGHTMRDIAKKSRISLSKTYSIIQRLRNFMQGIRIRPLLPEDMPFIYSTWLKGVLHGNKHFEQVSRDVYFKQYTAYINKLMQHSETRVACLREDASVILAYCVINGPVVHWAYTKAGWRQQGIQTLLAGDNEFKIVSHITTLAAPIIKRKKLTLDFWAC
jgi:hypothetical protein